MSAPQNTPAPFQWLESEDRIDLRGPGPRMSFIRIAGLWTHSLFLPEERGNELARALDLPAEHTNSGQFVRPVFEELLRHDNHQGSNLCVLLTGRQFHHHFSAVVNVGLDPERPEAVMLDFDVADRCRGPVASLAASYLVQLRRNLISNLGANSVTWDQVGGTDCRLELAAVAPSTLGILESGRNALRVEVLANIQPGNFTHRLHYRWRWTTSSGLTR
jgi:hypothetical protein